MGEGRRAPASVGGDGAAMQRPGLSLPARARGAATASVPARLPHATAASPRRSTSPGPCLGERVQAEEHRRRCARGVRECRAKRLLVPALHPAHSARDGVGGMAPRGMQALCTGSSRRDGGRWLGAGCFCGPLARGPSHSRAGRGGRRGLWGVEGGIRHFIDGTVGMGGHSSGEAGGLPRARCLASAQARYSAPTDRRAVRMQASAARMRTRWSG